MTVFLSSSYNHTLVEPTSSSTLPLMQQDTLNPGEADGGKGPPFLLHFCLSRWGEEGIAEIREAVKLLGRRNYQGAESGPIGEQALQWLIVLINIQPLFFQEKNVFWITHWSTIRELYALSKVCVHKNCLKRLLNQSVFQDLYQSISNERP